MTRELPSLIKPAAIHPYFDKLQVWIPKPLNASTLASLRDQCGRGGIFAENKPARFDARYRQRIEFRQPSDRVLRWLMRHQEVLINRAEVAVDYVFNLRMDRDDTFDFLHRHLVRRWHGKNQKIKLVCRDDSNKNGAQILEEPELCETRYDAGRAAPNKIVFYRERFSRITGELYCLHLEWHLNGLRAIRAAGIESANDLQEFSHRQFWQRKLLLRKVDPARLDRLTGSGGTSTRVPSTVQEILDQHRATCRIHRALIQISNEPLLPYNCSREPMGSGGLYPSNIPQRIA
jgi:hypothetical protein